MSVAAIRDAVLLPENRAAMQLLLRSTMAMGGVPVAVYYFCFNTVFGKDGWYDMSHDLNWRVNYSGFAAIAAVQGVIIWHVVSAFRQDAADMKREAEIKQELKEARALSSAGSKKES